MSTKLVEIYDAIWSALDNYAALTTFLSDRGGHKYKYSANDRLPGDLTKVDLPALIVTPAEIEEAVVLSGYTSETVSFDIEMHVAQRDIDVLLDFVWHVGAALKEKLRGSDANLGLSYVAGVALGGVRFDKHDRPDDYRRGVLWSAMRTITVEYCDAISA